MFRNFHQGGVSTIKLFTAVTETLGRESKLACLSVPEMCENRLQVK